MRRHSNTLAVAALALAAFAAHAQAQIFNASFESGNLLSATVLAPDHYRVQIRPDGNSTQRQWFYFSVAAAAGRTLTFDVSPFDISSPWTNGMTPCVSEDPDDPAAWGRVPPSQTSWATGALTFSWAFVDDDPVWFAYSFAYPFSRAQALVAEIAASPHATRQTVGQTLGGRPLDLLEITEGPHPAKVGVWVQARQHPAECGGSWACEGFLRWLVGPSDAARAVREHSVVRVLPMVNPDGVTFGNYRTNGAGLDLNRQWDTASAGQSPEVLTALTEIARLDADHGVQYFIDLHTHSSELKNWVFGVSGSAAFDQRERGYAQAIEDAFSDFSFVLSSFSNSSSGRVAKNRIHQLYPDALSYTQEQTYHTITYGPNAGAPINVLRYTRMGEALGEALAEFEGWTPAWNTYCTAKVNSLGCTPALHATGWPGFTGADDFHVVAAAVLNQTFGIYFWGLGPESSPLLGGTLCVRPPLQRTPVSHSGGSIGSLDCSGQFDFFWAQSDLLARGLLPGAVVFGQFWSRDALHTDGTGVSLTDGLRFTVLP